MNLKNNFLKTTLYLVARPERDHTIMTALGRPFPNSSQAWVQIQEPMWDFLLFFPSSLEELDMWNHIPDKCPVERLTWHLVSSWWEAEAENAHVAGLFTDGFHWFGFLLEPRSTRGKTQKARSECKLGLYCVLLIRGGPLSSKTLPSVSGSAHSDKEFSLSWGEMVKRVNNRTERVSSCFFF